MFMEIVFQYNLYHAWREDTKYLGAHSGISAHKRPDHNKEQSKIFLISTRGIIKNYLRSTKEA